MERKKLTRRVGVLAAVLLAAVFAGCATTGAKDVTDTGATLTAKGACHSSGYSGHYQYQVRRVGTGSWTNVGPQHNFTCNQETGEGQLLEARANLWNEGNERITWEYRLVSRLDDGSVQTWDSTGTNGGMDYHRFTVLSHTDMTVRCSESPSAYGCGGTEIIQANDDPPETVECDNGATACSSASQRRCKGRNGNPLTNQFTHVSVPTQLGAAIYGGRVNTDWCWKNGNVVTRHSVDEAWETDWGRALGWYVRSYNWVYSACTADQSSCLTRLETKHACCYIDQSLRVSIPHCIGTRICAYRCGENGAFHSRNIIHGACPR